MKLNHHYLDGITADGFVVEDKNAFVFLGEELSDRLTLSGVKKIASSYPSSKKDSIVVEIIYRGETDPSEIQELESIAKKHGIGYNPPLRVPAIPRGVGNFIIKLTLPSASQYSSNPIDVSTLPSSVVYSKYGCKAQEPPKR